MRRIATAAVALTLSASYFMGISTARQLVIWAESLPL
jgi:hypothetical protein